MWGVFSNRWNTKVGEVAGISQVAGLPCASVITKYDEDNRTTERCLALAGDERKTPDVEGRTLRYSSTWFPKGAPKKYLWSATTELVPYGLIDSAVFDVPKGIKLKESIDDRLKVQK